MVKLEKLTFELDKLTFRNVVDVPNLSLEEARTLVILYKESDKYDIHSDKEDKNSEKYYVAFTLKRRGQQNA